MPTAERPTTHGTAGVVASPIMVKVSGNASKLPAVPFVRKAARKLLEASTAPGVGLGQKNRACSLSAVQAT